jgi:hypothetical protein
LSVEGPVYVVVGMVKDNMLVSVLSVLLDVVDESVNVVVLPIVRPYKLPEKPSE